MTRGKGIRKPAREMADDVATIARLLEGLAVTREQGQEAREAPERPVDPGAASGATEPPWRELEGAGVEITPTAGEPPSTTETPEATT